LKEEYKVIDQKLKRKEIKTHEDLDKVFEDIREKCLEKSVFGSETIKNDLIEQFCSNKKSKAESVISDLIIS